MTNGPIDGITKLGKWGLVGVMLALIIATIISSYCTFSLAKSYMSESSQVMRDVSEAVTELSTIIKMPNKLTMKIKENNY